MPNSLNPSRNALIGQTPIGKALSFATSENMSMAGLEMTPIAGELLSLKRLVGALRNPPNAGDYIQNGEFNSREYGKAMQSHGGQIGLEAMGTVPLLGMAASIPYMMTKNARKGFNAGKFKQGGIIASTGAKNADMDAFEIAKKLKNDGVDADTIYAETKWWLDHPDGRPRFEIDDSGFAINHPEGLATSEIAPMGSINENVKHDLLFGQYPDTGDIRLSTRGGRGGEYIANDGFNERIVTGKGSEGHELQHAIQQREDMARGGSPDYSLINPHYQKEVSAQNAKMRGLEAERQELSASKEYAKEQKKASSMSVEDLFFNSHKTLPIQTKIDKISIEIADINANPPLESYSPYDGYRQLAGETEARLVQDRMNMTMDERLSNPFYQNYDVPIDQQIVRRGDGVSLSQPLPMDEASRMQRARDMGFDTDTVYYHGSKNSDFDEFRTPAFLANDKEYASHYAGISKHEGSPGMIPAYINKDGVLDTRTPEGKKLYDQFKSESTFNPEYEQHLMPSGLPEYDDWRFFNWLEEKNIKPKGIHLDEMNGETSVKIFDPKNIRSKFATFDPSKKNSTNILAGGLLGAVGINALNNQLERKNRF